ncbi:MAG: TIM barrel protein [Acidimicrobiia bacterium]|nr:non-homologous end-joining DNA ligase [Acidimicrobiia bacterium]MBT8215987.1 non-homologous end-joining DNA ligase [Acidimicrobiia bacterium]NNF10770.1 TIM barrel protein [Acidimicrobiia bacterium]NNL69201.1 TIM barrel protein [Acidimicrobiia bacterium]
MTVAFGISGLPPSETGDDAFLDGLAAEGHTALELAFTKGFPWKEARCQQFGRRAADAGIRLSVHAPYFAMLTIDEPDRHARTRAAVEHSMKLAGHLGAAVVVVHPGHDRERTSDQLLETALEALGAIEPKVRHLGVSLGLETTGTANAFGNLGDISLMAAEFPWVRPVVDWAHVHAITDGRLTDLEAVRSVFHFLFDQFPAWKLQPLHCHYSHNAFGPGGEIKHVPYGDGTNPVEPVVAAAAELDVDLTLVSESRDAASHRAVWKDVSAVLEEIDRPVAGARPLASGAIDFPDPIEIVADAGGFHPTRLRRPLRLSNPDKLFFPDGYTKGDLVQYYASISRTLLPHLAGRAIVMARFPDGADGDFFYEKQAPAHKPDWMPVAPIHSDGRGGLIEFCTAPDRPSLMWFANMGCIEIHPWLSRLATVGQPDFAIFDLDPAEGASWEQVVDTALHIRVALDSLGLRSYPKTSGASGLHIYVPLDPVHDYARVRKFVETVGRLMVAADPDNVTMEWDIPSRHGMVFIDHNQNVGGKTIASVYAVRPRAGAPVSTPLAWEEVPAVRPEDFTIATIWDRIDRVGDPFAPVLAGGQTLDAAEAALGLTT